jgi:pimeloyl-ACP methyl ester carboxylesterase
MIHNNYFEQLQTAPIDKGLHYWESGSGPTLLFLHGALSNGFTFRKILADLSSSFHCIALHLPLGGHHIPLSSDLDLSPSGIADLIAAFIQFKNIQQVHLVGNDTGGAYAQVFAAIYPEKTASLILSNCEVEDVFPPAKFAYLKYAVRLPGFTLLMAKLFGIKPWLNHSLVMGTLSLTLTNEELAQGYINSFVKDRNIRKDFAKVCRHWHPRHTLAAAKRLQQCFHKPVLILWGDKDELLFPRRQMEKFLRIFPHAKWETVYNAKTYIQEDAPQQTIQVIRNFLAAMTDEVQR